jgi:molybdopterin/thiamine biosynthesis adenylyltransferase
MSQHDPHKELAEALAALAAPPGEPPIVLTLPQSQALADQLAVSRRLVERTALAQGIVPERYARNMGTVGIEGQMALLDATVAVVGCGGLGGWVAEALARMGVGRLILIDGDRFEGNNLNRQLGCTERTLGCLKAPCLAQRLAEVNGAVELQVHTAWLQADNAPELLRGSNVIVDALDTLPARLMLQDAAAALGVPLVHGAIAGFTGQVMTILPGDLGLRALYGPGPVRERGIETTLGNPAATPMAIAAWQAQEVVKLLTHVGQPLRQRLLFLDTESGDARELLFS